MEHGPRLVIPSGHDGTTVLLAEPVLPFAGDVLVDVRVEIDAPGLQLRRWVRTIGGDGLETFLAGLDADFRGWDGARNWRSLEGDLSVRATHHGRHVRLSLTLLRDHEDDAWSVTVPLLILPGEDLRRLAADTADFFRTALAQEARAVPGS